MKEEESEEMSRWSVALPSSVVSADHSASGDWEIESCDSGVRLVRMLDPMTSFKVHAVHVRLGWSSAERLSSYRS